VRGEPVGLLHRGLRCQLAQLLQHPRLRLGAEAGLDHQRGGVGVGLELVLPGQPGQHEHRDPARNDPADERQEAVEDRAQHHVDGLRPGHVDDAALGVAERQMAELVRHHRGQLGRRDLPGLELPEQAAGDVDLARRGREPVDHRHLQQPHLDLVDPGSPRQPLEKRLDLVVRQRPRRAAQRLAGLPGGDLDHDEDADDQEQDGKKPCHAGNIGESRGGVTGDRTTLVKGCRVS